MHGSDAMNGSAALVDNANASQSRRVFWDQDVYQLELERIKVFSRKLILDARVVQDKNLYFFA
jgi:hypothetical protein